MITDELERLNEMRLNGALTEEEFQQAKHAIFSREHADGDRVCGVTERTWVTLMHLSQLLTFAGGMGILIPIVMWAVGKDQGSQTTNRHGLMIINWFLSELIYVLVGALLCLVLIGIPALIMLAIVSVVFPIVGAIKASDGEFWRYPLTIEFFLEDSR